MPAFLFERRSSNEGYVVVDGRKTDAGFFDNH